MKFPRTSARYDLAGTGSYRDLLAGSIGAASKSIQILSAFITTSGLQWLVNSGIRPDAAVTLVTQWAPNDLLSGASDLGAYAFARKQNWNFLLLPRLHAKVILVDDVRLFVGSANVTGFGLCLVPGGNRELGLCVAPSQADIHAVRSLVKEAIEVTPELYSEIEEWLTAQELAGVGFIPRDLSWPLSIQRQIAKPPTRLWVADLPWTEPRYICSCDSPSAFVRELIDHDARLYGTTDSNQLRAVFRESVAYKWLIHILRCEQDHTAYFGRLTQVLHSRLLDDPLPFRKEVKQLLGNLLAYVDAFASQEVILDRPAQSTRIRLIANGARA